MAQNHIRVFLLTLLLAICGTNRTFGQVTYDNTRNPLPGNVTSYGYEASGTSEFGDRIMFAPATGRTLTTVVLTVSSWGCQSGHWYSGVCVTAAGATFSHPLTLKIYNVVAGNQPGTLVGSVTQTFAIPFRPSADCTGNFVGKWFDPISRTCLNGLANNVTFNLGGLTVPDQVIFGIAYNTTHYGYAPLGEGAPCYTGPGGCGYDSLNVGLADPGSYNTVGSNPAPNNAYQYTIYSSCTNGPIIPFGLDAGCWTGFKPAIKFNAANPPLTREDCRNGGWQTHTTASGEPFPNQGQCTQYNIIGR